MKSANTSPIVMLTVEQTAQRLGLSARTVHRLIESGAIPKHQFARAVRISTDDLNTYIAKSRK